MNNAFEIDSTFTFASFYIAWANNYKYPQDNEQTDLWIERAYKTKENLPLEYQNWLSLWHIGSTTKNRQDIVSICNLLENSSLESRFFWFDLAVTYFSYLKQYEKAIEFFEKIEKISDERGGDWKYMDYYYLYGQILHLAGKHDKENEIFDLGLAYFPNNINKRDIYWHQAICALSRNDTIVSNDYIEKYKSVKKELGATSDNILRQLGNIHSKAYLYNEALAYYSKALSLKPEAGLYKRDIARMLIAGDIDVERGMELLEELSLIDPNYIPNLWGKARGLFKLGEYEKSLQLYREVWTEANTYNPGLESEIKKVEEAIAKNKSEQ
jgi:tetratricopeptide (TPR) repeat protein